MGYIELGESQNLKSDRAVSQDPPNRESNGTMIREILGMTSSVWQRSGSTEEEYISMRGCGGGSAHDSEPDLPKRPLRIVPPYR
jgi:hypothetical protein